MDVERKRADWPHWPDRDSGPPRRDRLERRLFRDSEREAEIESVQLALRQIELAAAAKAAEIERLEEAVGSTNGTGQGEAEPTTAATYLVFAPTREGYGLRVAEGDVPAPGARIRVDHIDRVVAKLGPSPLPGDDRRCAYLEPA